MGPIMLSGLRIDARIGGLSCRKLLHRRRLQGEPIVTLGINPSAVNDRGLPAFDRKERSSAVDLAFLNVEVENVDHAPEAIAKVHAGVFWIEGDPITNDEGKVLRNFATGEVGLQAVDVCRFIGQLRIHAAAPEPSTTATPKGRPIVNAQRRLGRQRARVEYYSAGLAFIA